MKKLAVIVLAAGQGTRMRSKLAKVLHPVCGRPMALYAADLAEALARGRVAVVVGHQAEKVKDLLADRKVELVVQARQLGTGHAVTQAQSVFQGRGGNAWSGLRFVILSGDTPLLTEATVRALLAAHERERATVSMLTAHLDRPVGYGRIVRGRDGSVWKIIEDKDATPAERRLSEVNAGTYVVEGEFLFPALVSLKPANVQKEYYLTDIVEAAIRQGKKVTAYIAANPVEALGINTRAELAEAERVLRGRVRQRLMEAGATFLAPETSFVDAGVKIGRDSVIHPHVTLEGRTAIGEDCVIRSHSRLVECALGDGVTVLDGCVIEGSRLEDGCRVGPFAHLRPGTIVGRNARVGNFVEMKKTELGEGSKANHLSYLGDARIGKRVNVGAGTITCNYDGVNKHQTVIEDDVFIGSDVSLVAPVKVGKGAMIAAGSVVTQDVTADALALGRARQVVKPGWVKGWREKMKSGRGRGTLGGAPSTLRASAEAAMCGIVGYIGSQEAVPVLLDGLKRLEYRGYDSAGVAVLRDGKIDVRRSVGKLANLEKALNGTGLNGTVGIGHTRWATHGRPSEQNAHPHRSGPLALVHNGIIENYATLKEGLQKDGYRFESETDTEVMAHLIARSLKAGLGLEEAVRAATGEVRGSYAIAVMSQDAPGTLVAARSGCPLIIGKGPHGAFVASDVTAILAHTRDVVFLEDGDIAALSESGLAVKDADGKPVTRTVTRIAWDAAAAEKGGYPHFMLKEIHEQPQVILDTMRGRYTYEQGEADLPDIGLTPEQFAAVDRIWIVACGTSWHAGLVGKYLIEEMVRAPVQVDIGSEFRYRDPLIGKGDLLIAISQSGETADTLAAVRHARQQGAQVVSICNVVGSTLARESDGVLYTHAGPEIGVASTKAFTAQLTALYLLALHLGRVRGKVSAQDGKAWLDRLVTLPAHVRHLLAREGELLAIAQRYHDKNNFLYLGRGINYPIALEGALKLKEISYIHAEGYAAGEMKHGPIALIDKDMPVVVLAPRDRLYEKTVSNLMEVKARNAPVIAFVTEGDRELGKQADAVFTVPDVHPLLTPVLFTVPLQLLAYHIAVLRGTDVDQPRNLAKSVTVE